MKLFALVAVGVYDQGIIGIYEDRAKARKAAKEVWPHSDGYHGFEIRPMILDHTNFEAFPLLSPTGFRRDPGELKIKEESFPE